MDHVVFFPSADGTQAFRRLASLDEAVRLVEHLRNVEGVDDVTLHALSEVPLQFKAYYRVEVPTALDVPSQPVPPGAERAPDAPVLELLPPAVAVVPEPASEPVAVAPVAVELASEPVAVEVEPEPTPALALVEDVPAVEADRADDAEQEPAFAGDGHAPGGVASLGFFA